MNPVMKPFIDHAGNEDGINSIEFYPKERIDEIFSRMAAAWNTDREAGELRTFYQRMRRMYDDFSVPSNTWLNADGNDENRQERWEALGEAAEDAAFLESIGAGEQA
jgi:hypothetical protein